MNVLTGVLGGLVGLLVLAAVLIAVVGWLIWRKVKGGVTDLVVKAQIAGQPPTISLSRRHQPVWNDQSAVRDQVNTLRSQGFRAMGTYGITGMDSFQLVALGHPEEGYSAAVFEHAEQGVWCDLAARFHDTGEYLVVSSAEVPVKMPRVPGFDKVFQAKAPVQKLLKTFSKKIGHQILTPITPETYVEFFETYYAEEMQGYYDVLGIEPEPGADPAASITRDSAADEACRPLFDAIAGRRLQEMEAAIQGLSGRSGVFEGRDEDGKTPLMAAVMTGDLAFCRPLIAAGADVGASVPGNPEQPFQRPHGFSEMTGREMAEQAMAEQDPTGDSSQSDADLQAMAGIGRILSAVGASMPQSSGTLTPLILAIWVGNDALAQELLAAGADPSSTVEPRPLHYAVSRGDLHMVNLLLRSGADLESVDAEGASPLMVAVAEEDVELVQWLLQAGADVDHKDEDGETALTLAADQGSEDLFEALVPRAKRHIRKARKMLAASADPERQTAAQRLIDAASDGKPARLQRLLSQGVDVDQPAEEGGWTALMAAAAGGRMRSIRLLLDAGANVNQQTADGESALSYAVGSRQIDPRMVPDTVQWLLDAGASLDTLDPTSRSRVVQLLQSRGGRLSQ